MKRLLSGFRRLGIKLKKRRQRVSLRRQIFAALFLVTLCVTGTVGELAYGFARNKIEENYQKSHAANLNNTSKVLDLLIQNLIDIARNTLNETRLCGALKNPAADGELRFSREKEDALRQTASSMANLDGVIDSIVFADLNGHCYLYSNINRGSYAFYQYYREHPLLEEAWVGQAKAAAGKEVFFDGGITGREDDGELCFVKYIVNPRDGKPLGLLIVNFSKQILKKSLIDANDGYPTSCYFVVGRAPREEVVYYENGGFSAGQDSSEEKEIGSVYRSRRTQKVYLFSEVRNETTGWTIVNAIRRNALSEESRSIRMLVLAATVVILAVSLEVSFLISRGITKPLSLLEDAIRSVEGGTRHLATEFDGSEVGQIGRQFKAMVNNSLELSERLLNTQIREREAQLLLLQAQISPHFLYNTLDSVYCMAMIHGDDEIAEMILALSDNFRLALNNGDKMITVGNSVQRVEEYVKLQNMRYHGRFALTVDVEEGIRSEKILNFILQPFVENAICHGLEPKIGPGSIRLEGKRAGMGLVFIVSDDGVGVGDPSVLEHGYGIQNVRERIRLSYGEPYGVTVKSSAGKSTVVRIELPADRNRGDVDAQHGRR